MRADRRRPKDTKLYIVGTAIRNPIHRATVKRMDPMCGWRIRLGGGRGRGGLVLGKVVRAIPAIHAGNRIFLVLGHPTLEKSAALELGKDPP